MGARTLCNERIGASNSPPLVRSHKSEVTSSICAASLFTGGYFTAHRRYSPSTTCWQNGFPAREVGEDRSESKPVGKPMREFCARAPLRRVLNIQGRTPRLAQIRLQQWASPMPLAPPVTTTTRRQAWIGAKTPVVCIVSAPPLRHDCDCSAAQDLTPRERNPPLGPSV